MTNTTEASTALTHDSFHAIIDAACGPRPRGRHAGRAERIMMVTVKRATGGLPIEVTDAETVGFHYVEGYINGETMRRCIQLHDGDVITTRRIR